MGWHPRAGSPPLAPWGCPHPALTAGRTKELAPQRLERFMQFSREQGLKDEEILILPKTGKGGQLTVAPGHAQPIGMEGGGGGAWRVVPDPGAAVPLTTRR